MNENGEATNNKPKKSTGLLATVIILSIFLLTAIIFLILLLLNSSGLNDEIKVRDNKIKSLEESVEKEKTEKEKCKSTAANTKKTDPYDYDAAKIIPALKANGNIGDHVRGKEDSKVVVVEYADLSCPGCATMMPRMTKIYEKYGDRVAFVFRHFPLKSHQNSRSAAAAAESAGRQGKYWEMLEALFNNRTDWIYATGQSLTETYSKLFKEVAPNGDEEEFRAGLIDAKISEKIDFDYNLGTNKSNVTMTPSIFVNGKLVDMTDDGLTFTDVENRIKSMIETELGK